MPSTEHEGWPTPAWAEDNKRKAALIAARVEEAESALSTAWPDLKASGYGALVRRTVRLPGAQVDLWPMAGEPAWCAAVYDSPISRCVTSEVRGPRDLPCTARATLAAALVRAMADKALPAATVEALRAGRQRLVAAETTDEDQAEDNG